MQRVAADNSGFKYVFLEQLNYTLNASHLNTYCGSNKQLMKEKHQDDMEQNLKGAQQETHWRQKLY